VPNRLEQRPIPSDSMPVSGLEARDELERVLSDSSFQCTERNKKFLRFIAEELFAGRASALKAYSVAVDVFGRPQSFDASTDPIVRIEATRLRAALIRYYELDRNGKGVQIRLPKGHYVPDFARVPALAAAEPTTEPESPPAGRAEFVPLLSRLPGRITNMALSLGALLAAVLIIGAGLFFQTGSAAITDRPSVSLDLVLSGGPDDSSALAMRDSLMIALSRFNTLRLSDAYTASAVGRRDPRQRSRYVIVAKYSADADWASVWWQVVDGESGEALRSGLERVPAAASKSGAADEQLVSTLAVRLASFRGVINTIETARDLETPSLGNGCVLRAGLSLIAANEEMLQAARSCLERTLKLRPYDADAHAALASVLLAVDPVDAPTALTQAAREHADAAVALAPESDRSYMAQMQVAFRTGRTEAAKQAGRRAIELNPYNASIVARYASIQFSLGDWDEAVPLAIKASQFDGLPQPEAERTLAFDAYRQGRFDEAALRLQKTPETHCYLTQLLLAAALAQAGRNDEAASVVSEIKSGRPDFERTFKTDMARRQLAPALTAALGQGLMRAGSKIE
jgi:tetratricopeptide (TPR) repeat protein